jgi:hypothetical protein
MQKEWTDRYGFVIYRDNGGVVKETRLSYVKHITPDRYQFADEYLYRMRSRCGYVRRAQAK